MSVDVEATAAAAAAAEAAAEEEGDYERVRVVLAQGLEEPQRCRCAIKCICLPCPFRTEKNLRTILAGTVLTTVLGHVICKNFHLCLLCWEDCERKNSHVPASPNVAASISRLLKQARRK